jgi:hypothetical protein
MVLFFIIKNLNTQRKSGTLKSQYFPSPRLKNSWLGVVVQTYLLSYLGSRD